jgi:adenylylsulfate kinase-like enzyme
MILWFIGMSGSGKSTLAEALYGRLKPRIPNLVYLDGDAFRDIFRNDVDHTVDGRRKNAERISHFCRVLDDQNIHVIAAVLSIFPEWQRWNRETFTEYREVFLDVPLDELERRDTKGLYSGAREGRIPNVVGFDIAFPRPAAPDLILGLDRQRDGVDACLGDVETLLAGSALA